MPADGQGYSTGGVGAGLAGVGEDDKKKFSAREAASTSLPKSSGFRTNRGSSNIKASGPVSPANHFSAASGT